MASATTTTNHDEIRKWAEERGGHPAIVSDTDDNGREGAILRIDFNDPGGDDDAGLEEGGAAPCPQLWLSRLSCAFLAHEAC